MPKTQWPSARLSPSVFAASNIGRFTSAFYNADIDIGKLRLVKTLLEKLESKLSDELEDRTNVRRSFDTSSISTFLDTPLDDFTLSGQVQDRFWA
jgi:hypothetical protein